MSSKPTLGSLLMNPQKDETLQQISNQKVIFPKINTKLKKIHFTKYRSAFIDLQPEESDQESRKKSKSKASSKYKAKFFKKINTESIHMQKDLDESKNFELKTKIWKLNKQHNQSYTIKSSETLNLNKTSAQKDEKFQRRDKIIDAFLNDSQIKKNQKAILLTQIRQRNISLIENIQTSRNQTEVKNKHRYINQNIERSNRIISLIEKNYKEGFFDTEEKKKQSMEKLEERLGLFSYLKREFVTKRQQLTSSKLNEYFKSPSNTKIEAKINYNTRSFLKEKLHNDYHSYKEVNRLRENLSTNAIKEEIKHKNREFNDELNKKYNVPYLSFLSLPKNLKIKVLENLTQNQERAKTNRTSKK